MISDDPSKNTINVCVSCDENYARYAGVTIASVLASAAPSDDLAFYILNNGISQESIGKILSLKSIKDCAINFVQVDENLFADYKIVRTHSYISLPTYFRLKMAELLPNVGKIIYFDCDIVVNVSLKPLFDANLNGAPIGGVLDGNKRRVRANPTYVNAGVLVFDLKKIREIGLEKEFLEYTKANAQNITCGDQGIINDVLKNRIKLLDKKWNVQCNSFASRTSYTRHPWIIHYICRDKPWMFASRTYLKEYYFKYMALTPWANEAHGIISEIASWFVRLGRRPFFMFNSRFWEAAWKSCIKEIE